MEVERIPAASDEGPAEMAGSRHESGKGGRLWDSVLTLCFGEVFG